MTGQTLIRWSLMIALTSTTGVARAQQRPGAPPAAKEAQPPADLPRQVGDLTTRYRFIERYAPDPARAGARDLLQYRVASKDVLKRMTEKPQGSPDRAESTVQVIYTERPAQVSPTGQVADVVRNYDAVRISPAPDVKPSTPRPLESLTMWYHNRSSGMPFLMTLTPNHPLTEVEYNMTRHLVFTPDLAGALPTLPSRVGDRWRIPRSASRVLLGGRTLNEGEGLVGTLIDVRKSENGSDMVALIGVSGRSLVGVTGRDTLLNARIKFSFAPPAADANSRASTDGAVDARGAITELRMARTTTMLNPVGNGRLKSTLTWELLLERKIQVGAPTITLPAPPPAPTVDNSWLTYDDPSGRFHFRHPQELLPPEDLPPDSDMLQFVDSGAGATEGRILTLAFQAKDDDPAVDKANRDPDFHVKDLNEQWARDHKDVLRGKNGWLPEHDWTPYKMKVYRIEAALRNAGAGRDVPRIFLDHYLVLFGGTDSLVVEAMTGLDDPLPYRKQVEDLLKTFRLGPAHAPGS